jgi:hypothetical protein
MYKQAYKVNAPLPAQEDKQAALRYILEAWEEAVYDGLDPDCIATAAIFAALSDMIAKSLWLSCVNDCLNVFVPVNSL